MDEDAALPGPARREPGGAALRQAERRRRRTASRARFLDEWLKSPPHRDNLAFADYDRTGVGAAVNGDTVYVTALFATDLGLGPHIDKNATK